MQRRRTNRNVPTKAVSVQLLLDGYVAAYGSVEDISLGGARLAIGEDFPSAEEIEIRIAAEDRSALSFHTTAKVVWCQPATSAEGRNLWGVHWTHFPRTAKHVLEALIADTCREV
jgi:Tfp pilus assembly protein PilZ